MIVLAVHHRKVPLIQGGLQIPIQIIVEMDSTEENRLAMSKYEVMTSKRYQEPIEGT